MTQTDWATVPEAEDGFLGLTLWHNSPFPHPRLKPEHFDKESTREIYKAILAVASQGQVTDPISVSEHLEHIGITEIDGFDTYTRLCRLYNVEMEKIDISSPKER